MAARLLVTVVLSFVLGATSGLLLRGLSLCPVAYYDPGCGLEEMKEQSDTLEEIRDEWESVWSK
jgi:hypothetical protein